MSAEFMKTKHSKKGYTQWALNSYVESRSTWEILKFVILCEVGCPETKKVFVTSRLLTTLLWWEAAKAKKNSGEEIQREELTRGKEESE